MQAESNEQKLREQAEAFGRDLEAVRTEVEKVMVGHKRLIEATLTALFCGGHVLLEGVPGLGKTELVKTVARVLDLEFNRVQFTPDLMPADIVGTNVMTGDGQGGWDVEFRRGPIFTQLLLADEINRATPKTQSALLETMQERTVTVGGKTYELAPPFFTLATQNPIEQEGTYPLPEAQLDRFMFKLNVTYLNRAELNAVVKRTVLEESVAVGKVMDAARIGEIAKVVRKVVVAEPMRDFAVRLTLATHPQVEGASERVKRFVRWGASPRAAQALIRAAQVRALGEGRVHVSFDDVRYFAEEVLGHRVLLNYDGQAEDLSVPQLVSDLAKQLPEEAA